MSLRRTYEASLWASSSSKWASSNAPRAARSFRRSSRFSFFFFLRFFLWLRDLEEDADEDEDDDDDDEEEDEDEDDEEEEEESRLCFFLLRALFDLLPLFVVAWFLRSFFAFDEEEVEDTADEEEADETHDRERDEGRRRGAVAAEAAVVIPVSIPATGAAKRDWCECGIDKG